MNVDDLRLPRARRAIALMDNHPTIVVMRAYNAAYNAERKAGRSCYWARKAGRLAIAALMDEKP